MPWRKSLKTIASAWLCDDPVVNRSQDLFGDRPVVELVDLEHAVAAGDEDVLLRRRPGAVDDRRRTSMPACSRSFSTKSFSASSPSTVENVTSAPAALQVLGDDRGAADEVDLVIEAAG